MRTTVYKWGTEPGHDATLLQLRDRLRAQPQMRQRGVEDVQLFYCYRREFNGQDYIAGLVRFYARTPTNFQEFYRPFICPISLDGTVTFSGASDAPAYDDLAMLEGSRLLPLFMQGLVGDTESAVQDLQAKGESDCHLTACHQIADRFNLWEPAPAIPEAGFPEPGERFPIWLSRVVAGAIQDASEKSPYAPGDNDT